MTKAVKDLYEAAKALSAGEQLELAEMLVGTAAANDDEDADIEAAWISEIQRRIADVDNGTVKLIPWDDARESIFARD